MGINSELKRIDNAIVMDPQFISGIEEGTFLTSLDLKQMSPLIEAGIEIPGDIEGLHEGTAIPTVASAISSGKIVVDYAGNPLYNGNPDIGIFEYQGNQDSTGTLSGYVRDKYCNLISDTIVLIDETKYSAISHQFHKDGHSRNFKIIDTNITRLMLI